MKFGVVVFPGSNCDRDILYALESLHQEVVMIFHKENDLSGFSTEDCIVLPGGFSYGDYLRCGSIARFSPVMKAVVDFANRGGKVFGICNGFQILCESGLLPGVLLQNERTRFVCNNAFLKSEKTDKIYKIPIAHGEGRYYASAEVIKELEEQGQILFRYCNEDGEVSPTYNPNGSTNEIAGICNREGNVIGMMPHPERACNLALSNMDGKELLEELFEELKEGRLTNAVS